MWTTIKSTPAAPQTDLAAEVAALQAQLAAAEAAHVDPRVAVIDGIRAELDSARARLRAREEPEALEQRRKQSQAILRVAESEVENIKNGIMQLRARFAALPAQIQNAELRFHRALKISADAKSAVARLETQ